MRVVTTQNTTNAEASPPGAISTHTSQPLPSFSPSDACLLAQIEQHHEIALGVLYDRYSRFLYTVAVRIIADERVAEEVIQDVFSNVWHSAGSFHRDGDVKAWLIGITRHRAIDTMRVRNFRVHNNAVALDGLYALCAANETETQVIALLEQEQVRCALNDIPAIQRDAIELAYYAGLTSHQIAIHTGVSIGTVKTRLRLGLAKLRTRLLP